MCIGRTMISSPEHHFFTSITWSAHVRQKNEIRIVDFRHLRTRNDSFSRAWSQLSTTSGSAKSDESQFFQSSNAVQSKTREILRS